jgi:hypothetical protein
MHYKNGREAKNGDIVTVFPPWGPINTGVLHSAVAGNDSCNGALASVSNSGVNLAECLHSDDVKAALGDLSKVPDTTVKAA